MRLSRTVIFSYLLAIYLVYSTIANYSIYYIGLLPFFGVFLILFFYGMLIRPSIIAKERANDNICFILGWGVVFSISLFINGVLPRFLDIYGFLICLLILCIKIDIQKCVFRKFVWILSILFIISAVEYIIIILTGKGVIIADVTRVTEVKESHFYHYLFNIISVYDILYRFKGLFPEPGDMGTLCAFLLFSTWRIKSMRFPFFVFIVCGMMSLSLAFYVFLFIFLLTNVKPNIKNISVGVVLFAAFLYIFGNYFEGRLVDRLTSVDNVEELDNRTTDTFDHFFYRAYDKGDLWFGVGSDNLPSQVNSDGGNAGAKKWIFQYGIIGFVLIFFIYNAVYYRRCNKRLGYHDIVFLLVFWACFYKSVPFLIPTLFLVYIMMPIINKKTNVL